MPKYIVETKCYGFQGRLWEKGQIVVLPEGTVGIPPLFKRLGEPAAAKAAGAKVVVVSEPGEGASAAELVKFSESAELESVEAGKLARAAAKEAAKKSATPDAKAKAQQLADAAKAAAEKSAKAKKRALEALEKAKEAESGSAGTSSDPGA